MNTDILEQYEIYQRDGRGLRPRTIANYRPEIADFLRFLGCRDLSVVAVAAQLAATEKQRVLEFLRRPTLPGRPPGAVTFNLRLSAIRSLYDYLCRLEVLTMNATANIDRQRSHDKSTIPLTLDELIRLVSSVRDNSVERYRARNVGIVQVLVHCSLRVHEVMALNLDQIDFEHHLLLDVRRKGGKSLASAMNDVVAEALQACIAAREGLSRSEAEPALFLSDRGTRFSVRATQELVSSHGGLAGIRQPVTPHLLRHSSATQLAALGTPIRVVQDICGHASIATTQRYVHSNGEDRQRAVDALALIWNRQRGLTADPEVGNASRPI